MGKLKEDGHRRMTRRWEDDVRTGFRQKRS
jgi:hypothetical protein